MGLQWRDFGDRVGNGQAVPLSADTGYFWFFNEENVEAISKVLDGRPINGHFWTFHGALSNVEYNVTVTDATTGLTRRYFNPSRDFASVGDTFAFGPRGARRFTSPGSSGAGPSVAGGLTYEELLASWTPDIRAVDIEPPGSGPVLEKGLQLEAAALPPIVAGRVAPEGVCTTTSTRLCLDGGRFAIEAAWTDFAGNSGMGTAVSLTDDTGDFWFFRDASVETVLKVLDGTANNGNSWVLYGSLSNADYDLVVTDTLTGRVKTYQNRDRAFASVGDTEAFSAE